MTGRAHQHLARHRGDAIARQPRPILASFVAAALALMPLLLMALTEVQSAPPGVVPLTDLDDAGTRGAALILAAMPVGYLGAVPVCYAAGALLVRLNLRSFAAFLAGAAGLAVLVGVGIGILLATPSRWGLQDLMGSMAGSCALLLAAALPASAAWWVLAGRSTMVRS